MKKLAVALLLVLLAPSAWAQNAIVQGGAIRQRAASMWLQDRQLGDAGGLTGRTSAPFQGLGLLPFSVTDGNDCGLQFNNLVTTGSYNSLCFGHNASGNAVMRIGVAGVVTEYPLPGTVSVTGMVTAANKAALESLSTATQSAVMLLGYTAAGDAPAIVYNASSVACAANGGNGNGFTQIRSADSKCWLYEPESGQADARNAGYKADGYINDDGNITTGTTTFTSAARACSASDVGKGIEIAGAGATVTAVRQPLFAVINSCSGSAYIISVAASNTSANVLWALGTDNGPALASATAVMSALRGKLRLPGGVGLWRTGTVTMDGVAWECTDVPVDTVANTSGTFAGRGTVLAISSTTLQPFYWGASHSTRGCQFIYPGQFGLNANPVIYPPLAVDNVGGGGRCVENVVFNQNTVMNAYRFATWTCNGGNLKFFQNNIYGIDQVFEITSNSETALFTNNIFNPSIFTQPLPAAAGNLVAYTQTNGVWLKIRGNGSAVGGACSSALVAGGFETAKNLIWAYRYYIQVLDGTLDESSFNDTSVNAGTMLAVDLGGRVGNTTLASRWVGGVFPGGGADDDPLFDFETTCNTAGANVVNIRGALGTANGTVLQMGGNKDTIVSMSLGSTYPWGISSTGGTYWFALVNNVNASVDLFDNFTRPGSGASGIGIQEASNVRIRNYRQNGGLTPIVVNDATSATIVEVNDVSLQNVASSITGTGAAQIKMGSGNSLAVVPNYSGTIVSHNWAATAAAASEDNVGAAGKIVSAGAHGSAFKIGGASGTITGYLATAPTTGGTGTNATMRPEGTNGSIPLGLGGKATNDPVAMLTPLREVPVAAADLGTYTCNNANRGFRLLVNDLAAPPAYDDNITIASGGGSDVAAVMCMGTSTEWHAR